MGNVCILGLYEYIVIVLSLIVSLGIGIRFHFVSEKEKTSRNFMFAGSNMPMLPIILSLTATHISSILIIGTTAEIYLFGSQITIMILGFILGMLLSGYIFLPAYFNLGISTIYQYLEMRYGKFLRIFVSGLFVCQMLLYMSVVLHAPALALSAVTDLSTETSILLMGIVCIIYCAMGGLKAVLWTDAFQSILMYACVFAIVIAGTMEAGGISEVIHKSKEGMRWEFFNFSMDLTTRYTVWNTIFRGFSFGVGGFGINQLEVQRLLSINDIERAQSALLYSLIPLIIIIFFCNSMGLILYSVFYLCDPILNGEQTGLKKYDQIVPYFIVTRFSHIPGLTGLCIAGLFSGSLSTISSAVNSIATVTVVDFIQPHCSCLKLKDKQIIWIAKGLVILYGLLCIGLTFTLANLRGLTEMGTVTLGIMEGPVAAIFLLGVLTVKTNQTGATIGFLSGCLLSGWIGFGSSLSGYTYPKLPISTESCLVETNMTQMHLESVTNSTFLTNSTSNITSIQQHLNSQSDIFIVYRISYMWIPILGFFCTACVSYTASVTISWNKQKKIDINFLSPVVKNWMDNSAFEDTEEINLEERNKITSLDETAQTIKCKTISDCKL